MVNPMEEAIVRCKTTAGPFVLKLERSWSPNGYDRAVELFERGFFDQSHFFRVVNNFLVQFGISYSSDKELQRFARSTIKDDPPKGIKFQKGTVSYAGNGDDSRTSQLFISYGHAASLGRERWETAIGEVIEGMENIENFYSYGDMPPWGKGPNQGKIHSGPSYIEDNFPKTDKFIKCRTERLNTVDDDDNKIKVVRKSDHITDEEKFAEDRMKDSDLEAPVSQGKLRLNSPLKNQRRPDPGDNVELQSFYGKNSILYAGCFSFLVVILIKTMHVKSRKKLFSKSN